MGIQLYVLILLEVILMTLLGQYVRIGSNSLLFQCALACFFLSKQSTLCTIYILIIMKRVE